ncbi:MAG: PHA/PHB synthase family protein [Gammaproteobacteria bacterium]
MKNSNKTPKDRTPPVCPIQPQPAETYEGRDLDRELHARASQFMGWFSPAALRMAWADWFTHLMIYPGKRQDIRQKAYEKLMRYMLYLQRFNNENACEPCIECRQGDHRFISEGWNDIPYKFYSQAFMLWEQLWGEAAHGVPGVSPHHEYIVDFFGRQFLDVFAPSNFPWTNPEIASTTIRESGYNFVRGFYNLLEDIYRRQTGLLPVGAEAFQVGKDVAITPGKVIYRNRLIELIQYEPTTAKVWGEPVLIVPAWIMKYYILDLSPHNSMVKYLVEQGHTVFMISWKNPTADDRDLNLEDYVNFGIMDALTAINAIIPKQKVHTVGYCIGGTLLTMAAAAMAGRADDRLKTITLFAAQVDFQEAGEILLFVDESQINYLEDIIWEKGYLDGAQMGGAFSMLRSVDLIWSSLVRTYLLGDREPMSDLMAWDADTTRLPFKMHSQYLRSLFLNNDLVEDRFAIAGKNVALLDIKTPLFVVSTVTDHVAPWKSVYKIHFFTDTEVTFVLTNGGHNAGVVSEPGHPNRSFQMQTHKKEDKHVTAEVWQEQAKHYEGSWWPEWHKWLIANSDQKVSVPKIGSKEKGFPVLCNAPGTYVLER